MIFEPYDGRLLCPTPSKKMRDSESFQKQDPKVIKEISLSSRLAQHWIPP